jgi:hypothetical protein
MSHAANNSSPLALSSMLELDCSARRLWREEDLAGVLLHQLAATLPGGHEPASPRAHVADPAGSIRTFGDLLRHPSPPVELLVAAKDFAKASRADPDAALPREIAAALYFAAIVVARNRCGRTISRLSAEELRSAIDWARAQPWIDAATRQLFDE